MHVRFRNIVTAPRTTVLADDGTTVRLRIDGMICRL